MIAIGPFSFPIFPLALLLAGWVTLAAGAGTARRLEIDGDHIYNAGLYGLLAGLAAGRSGHVIAFWSAYRTQPLEIIGLNTGAFLQWPAVAGGLLVIGWYIHRHGLPWAKVLDAAAVGMLAGLIVADLGALLAGQLQGAPANLPWAVTVWGVPRHPSAIYEALAAAITLVIVLRILRSERRSGSAAWGALMGYGLSRWLLEPFRANSVTMLGGIRIAQVIGLAAALLALQMLYLRKR